MVSTAQSGRLRRQQQQSDVIGNGEHPADVSASAIEQQDGVGAGDNGLADFVGMDLNDAGVVHRPRHRRASSTRRADGAEQVALL